MVLPARAASSPWASQTDPGLGFRDSYPSEGFSTSESDGKPYFHYFASPSSEVKFLVGGWNNAKGQSPEAFKRWLIQNVGGYDETTYRPKGRSWFVLSGYRGNRIYYEKVMFSCGGSVVNVFAITYPTEQREVQSLNVWRMVSGQEATVPPRGADLPRLATIAERPPAPLSPTSDRRTVLLSTSRQPSTHEDQAKVELHFKFGALAAESHFMPALSQAD